MNGVVLCTLSMQALSYYDAAIASDAHDESAYLNRAITKVCNISNTVLNGFLISTATFLVAFCYEQI